MKIYGHERLNVDGLLAKVYGHSSTWIVPFGNIIFNRKDSLSPMAAHIETYFTVKFLPELYLDHDDWIFLQFAKHPNLQWK